MRKYALVVTCALAATACASSNANQEPTTPEKAAQTQAPPAQGDVGTAQVQEASNACPMAVQAATVRAEDLDGELAMAFTTTGDVDALRTRVRHMADMYNRHQAGGHGFMMHMMQMHGGPGQPGMMGGSSGMQGGMMNGPGATQGPTQGGMMNGSGGMQGGGMQGGGMQGGGMQGGGMQGGGMQGSSGMQSGGMHGMQGGGMMMPPSTARAEDIEGGARLVLKPNDPSQLPTLRQHAQQMATGMTAGQCPVMGQPAGQGADAPTNRPSDNPETQP